MAIIRINDIEISETADEMYVHHTINVDKGQESIRIDKFLMDKLDNISRSRIQNAIKANCIVVGDKYVKANYKIRPFDSISIILPRMPEEEYGIQPEYIPLDIVYEDDDVLVINKPPGLVVHPGIGNMSGTLANAVMFHFTQQNLDLVKNNENPRPGIVHRIDKDTSGLMVIGKNEFALSYLAKQFFEHTIEREYFALVWGEPPQDKGTIEGYIGRHPRERMNMTTFEDDSEGGKYAITHYEVLEHLYYVSLVKCKLETGRTHQIRVHMKSIGNALFNDDRYGGNRILKGTIFSKYRQFVDNAFAMLPRQALHARVIGFDHPTKGTRMRFECPLPDDFENVLNKWRNYVQTRRQLIDKEKDDSDE